MSHYVECEPGFKDQQALIDALTATGFDRDQIEVHAESAALYGYRGLADPAANKNTRRGTSDSAEADVPCMRAEPTARRAVLPRLRESGLGHTGGQHTTLQNGFPQTVEVRCDSFDEWDVAHNKARFHVAAMCGLSKIR